MENAGKEEAARGEQKETSKALRKAGSGNRGVGKGQMEESEQHTVCVTKTRSLRRNKVGEGERWKDATSAAIKDTILVKLGLKQSPTSRGPSGLGEQSFHQMEMKKKSDS